MIRPGLLPTGHSRQVGRRIMAGNGHLPTLSVDRLLRGEPVADNENEPVDLIAGFLLLGLLVATFIVIGVLRFMLGRGA